ncbi:uncharacterized protein [Diadema setosum]|uniref:uncharacterized protein n=1 Tax=Diadema setosum TaxID=31175 RepID=UPI003B3BAB2E
MWIDDRKVWFRFQESQKDPASLQMLLNRMSVEMNTRIRCTAPLRSDHRTQSTVGHVARSLDKKQPDQSPTQMNSRPQSHRCWICKTSTHWVDQCRKLLEKTPQERWKYMKDNHACFSCLKRASKDHNMSTCKRRKQCPEVKNGERCKFYHHPLLHTEDEVTCSTNDNGVGVASVSSTGALLPLVIVELHGDQGKRWKGNLLLDSGSQISLIRQDLASEMQLSGVPTTITISKIGGEEESLQTQQYRVPIRELNSTNRPFLITAVGIPCISENIAVNIEELVRKFDIQPGDLNRGNGAVDLLVGIDHARLHTGEVREAGRCTARKSPVGWVIFGTTPNDAVHGHAVPHVKLAGPVDLTEFWTVETEGIQSEACYCKETGMSHQKAVEEQLIRSSARKVGKQWEIAYPWNKDPELLPDNKIQAEKVLHSTEKRLERNPEYAEAYDKQIKEMEEMGFCKKLSAQTMKEYEGPVHYISHHGVLRPEKKSTPIRIVFNSSASYHGHCLNSYWM